MILQSLNSLYDRLLAEEALEPPGFQRKEILWLVELNPDGTAVGLQRTGAAKERGRRFTVPAEIKRAVNIAANLLWDNAEYVLGIPRAKADDKQAAKVPARHAAFIERIRQLPPEALADEGVRAVLAFLEKGDLSALKATDGWAELAEGGANVSFHLAGETRLVCERPQVRTAIAAGASAGGGEDHPWCLVTGKRERPARLHPSIKGVFGGQSSGTSLVSFNLDAFTSHGWEQGDNAPVGEAAAMAYTAALNHMLERRPSDDVTYSHREGETTFLFWAAAKTDLRHFFSTALGDRAQADTDTDGKPMAQTLASVRRGLVECRDDQTGFFILALAPNAARLAVRSWHATTVGEVAKRFDAHFEALDIVGPTENRPIPTLWRLLGETMPKADIKLMKDGLRGRLSGDIVTAILDGTPYPATLLARVVERCRLENSVRPLRAALIKAIISRRPISAEDEERIPTVSLDLENTNPGYLLGRLFAVLEGIQHAAQGKINTTIRDRYFGAAMTSPRAVYTQLERLKNSHLKKLRRDKGGHGVFFEREFEAITEGMTADRAFPATLSLDDQGRFILGYHHQRYHYLSRRDAAPPELAAILATDTDTDSED
jgi:CRISPR-associated protein Csd1